RSTGAVHALDPVLRVLVQCFAFETSRLVAHAYCLERNGGEDAPARRDPHLLGEPLRVGDVTSQASLQLLDALVADEAPELQRAEAAPQWNPPVAKILHPTVHGAL